MTEVGFLLIPGAGGSAWYWHRVVPVLERYGHEAIAVDLPAADAGAGLPQYADAAVRAWGTRPAERLVVVAQSLGGFTAPLVCQALSPAMLVFLNAMIPLPGETPGAWWGNTDHATEKGERDRRAGREADAAFDPLYEFFHDVPQPVIDDAWAQAEPRQAGMVFGSPCDFESWPAVPIQVLVGRDDRFFPAPFQQRIARERLDVEVDQLPGGHLLALSQPDALAERLAGYAASLHTA